MNVGLYIDIGLCVAVLIGIIVGILLGFTKQFSRPLVTIVAIVGAIALVALVYPLLLGTGILDGLTSKIASWFSADCYSAPITSVEDLQATIADNYLRILSSLSDKMYARMTSMLSNTSLEVTIGNFFAQIIVNVVIEVIMWLAFYFAIKYLLLGIKYLLKKITRVTAFKVIDKIFGLLWGATLTYFVVVGILLSSTEMIITSFVTKQEATFANWITNSTILKFVHNTNFFGSYLAKIFGASLITLP